MEPSWLTEYRHKNEAPLPTLAFPLEQFTEARSPGCGSNVQEGLVTAPNLFIQSDGNVPVNQLSSEAKKSGVILTDLQTAILQHPELVRQSLPALTDPLSKLAASRFKNGLFLFVPNDTALDLTVQTVAGLPANTLNVINAGVCSTLRITIIITGNGALNQHTHLMAESNSNIIFNTRQQAGPEAIIIDNHSFVFQSCSNVTFSAAHLGGKNVISRRDTKLEGSGTRLVHTDLTLATGQQRYDLKANAIHAGHHTCGDILTQSLVAGNAKVSARGLLTIGKNGHDADSFVAQHALLLDKGAAAECVPDLEIHTNDVKASHAASVTPLNKEHIFYLASRGVDESTARKELALGSIEPALDRVPNDFAAMIRAEIAKRLVTL